MAAGIGAVPFAAFPQDGVIVREGAYWVETVKGEIHGPVPRRIRVISQGAVTLRGGSDPVVRYSVRKRAQARSAGEARARLSTSHLRVIREGDLVRLELVSAKPGLAGVDISLTAPRAIRWSEIQTEAGSVAAIDLAGQVSVTTGAGRVDLDRIDGECNVRTGGGDLQVGRIGGAFRCYTGGGAIRILSVGGLAQLETAGGDISLEDAGGSVSAVTGGGSIHVGRSRSSVSARTSAGLIDVRQAGGPVVADNSGGVIEVDSAKGAQCASTAGAIRLKNVAGNLLASARSGSILADLLGGQAFADSTLTASLGDVTVLIPPSISMRIIARNESAGARGGIFSDFPEIRVKLSGSGMPGPAMAEGVLNGGGPILHINVSSGSIFLRRHQ